jgi:hypothetical protein
MNNPMETRKYTLETMYEIWNDRDGSHIEVGPDRDGLDCIEIRTFEKDNEKPIERILLDEEQARLVAAALVKAADDLKRTIQPEKRRVEPI